MFPNIIENINFRQTETKPRIQQKCTCDPCKCTLLPWRILLASDIPGGHSPHDWLRTRVHKSIE